MQLTYFLFILKTRDTRAVTMAVFKTSMHRPEPSSASMLPRSKGARVEVATIATSDEAHLASDREKCHSFTADNSHFPLSQFRAGHRARLRGIFFSFSSYETASSDIGNGMEQTSVRPSIRATSV